MPEVITSPTPSVRQLSGQLPEQGWFLSVLARRTYHLEVRSGRCVPAMEQTPLQEKVSIDGETKETLADTDLVHWKPLTDIIVLGHGHARAPQRELGVGMRLGTHSKLVTAVGARRAGLNGAGHVVFSQPEPFAKVPLSFKLAYGGRDTAAEAKHGIPAARYAFFLPMGANPEDYSPYVYPRNPSGRGFVVEATHKALEVLELPQLEDPNDRLTPNRLAAGDPLRWPEMPVPQSLGWMGLEWFPRVAYLGVVPMHHRSARPLVEVAKGWAPAHIATEPSFPPRIDMRAANGASLGLQVPYLRGDEDGSLHNLSALAEVVKLKLPGERPRIWTDGRNGKLNKTTPVIHSVILEPDELRVSIVWRGNAPAIRPYMKEELATMPLRVEW